MADGSLPTMLAAQAQLANKPVEQPSVSSDKTKAQLKQAAQQFESIFLSQMFGLMNQDLPTDGPFGGGQGESMVRSLLNDQYSKAVVSRGGIGLSDTVYRELLAYQESGTHAATPATGPSKTGKQ